MNDYINLLKNRISVRDFIKDKKIPEVIQQEMVQAAQKAASSFNLQTYCVISVVDENIRKQIALLSENQQFIADASLFYLVCVDLYKIKIVNQMAEKDYYQQDTFESTLMGIIDASLFGQALATAAESFDLGVCFIGGVRSNIETIDKLLKLPEKVFPIFGLAVGYPVKRNKTKPRIPSEGIFFHDEYNAEQVKTALLEYDTIMKGSGIYQDRQYKVEEFGEKDREKYGWIEHSARRTSTHDMNKTRKYISDYLKKKNIL